MRNLILATVVLLMLFVFSVSLAENMQPDGDNSPPTKNAGDILNQIARDSYFLAAEYQLAFVVCEPNEEFNSDTCFLGIEQLIDQEKDKQQLIRIRFKAALIAIKHEEWKKAKAFLAPIDGHYPLLQDYIDFFLGESLYQARDLKSPLTFYKKVPLNSRLYLQAQFRIAFCLAGTDKVQGIEKLDILLGSHPNHFRSLEARFKLAELIRWKDPKRARELYLKVMEKRPNTGLGKTAEERLPTLRVKKLNRVRLAEIVIAKAKSYMRQFEYRKAQRILNDEIVKYPPHERTLAIVGELQYQLGRSLFKRRRYSDCIRNFDKVLESKANHQTKGLALYMKLEANMRKGNTKTSIKLAKQFLHKFPAHEKACTIRHLEAKAHKIEDNYSKAVAAYSDLTMHHPTCSYVPEAMWHVGWLHYKNGNFDLAKQSFSRIATSNTNRFEKERAMYWIARILTIQQDKHHAVDVYRMMIRKYPLSYYSNLATQRLKELNVPLPPPYMEKANLQNMDITTDLSVDLSVYRNNRSFKKGVEFLLLGNRSFADREFKALRKQFDNDENLFILLAYLYRLTEDYNRSIYLFRTKIKSYSNNYPGKTNRSGWMLSYPYIFAEQTVRFSEQVGLDPLLLMSLMREESSFQSNVKSYAHAVGLTQIIYGTGRQIARQLGHKNFKLDDLTDPEISIRFGSFHLKELIGKFKGNHALAISSYNAGESAVRRWIRKKEKDVPMDEFIEDIPYSQTRKYTRRVLKSYGIYRYLYSDSKRDFRLWKTVRKMY